jgi:hypothetical protein
MGCRLGCAARRPNADHQVTTNNCAWPEATRQAVVLDRESVGRGRSDHGGDYHFQRAEQRGHGQLTVEHCGS